MSQVGIEVQELAECGEYQSVEVVHALDSGCGGVLQLRQGRQLFRVMMRMDSIAGVSTPHHEVRTESSSIRLLLFPLSKNLLFLFSTAVFLITMQCDFSLKFRQSMGTSCKCVLLNLYEPES